MKLLIANQTISAASGVQLAKLGAAHGYRFDGDTVRLNAMFTVLHQAAHARQWALQLWACSTIPASADNLDGLLVAEVVLPPMGEVADDTESFEVSSQATIPAGSGDCVMVLALVCKNAGQRDAVQDIAVYPQRERFCLPRMAGNASYRIDENRVIIDVERIENPRDAANLSGTLALELWALANAYRGGAFNGVPLAGVAFDSLSGQCEYRQRTFNLPFTQPPVGTWNLVLMLREWTGSGYVTRDYTNFSVPMTVEAPAVAPVASVTAPAEPRTKPSKRRTKSPVRADRSIVSVNKATKEDLAAIKGLPKKVAAGIISKRPFRSLDDLVKVKGMGARLLAKVRSKLKL